jgi:hypothetical protein
LSRKRPSPSAEATSASRGRGEGQGEAGLFLGAAQQFAQGGRIEPVQDQHLRPAEQRGVEREAGVFGGGADQRDRAVFHHGQEAILLRAVEAVDLVHEQQGAPPGQRHGFGLGEDFLEIGHARKIALIATKRMPTASASSRAMEVLPVPGGPHRIIEESLPAATIRPIAPSGPVRWPWPITWSSARGRSRSASGPLKRLGARGFLGRRGKQIGHRQPR